MDNINDFGDGSINFIRNISGECFVIEEEVAQKCSDIKLLQEEELRLKTETKQRELETIKMELLTEQDNYDYIEKKLNDETELMSETIKGQEVISKHTKFYLDQILVVRKFQEEFEEKLLTVNSDYENILSMFKELVNEQNIELKSIYSKNLEINNYNLPIIKNLKHLEEQLKVKFNDIEEVLQRFNVEYYKQDAVLEYLKNKFNKIVAESNDLKNNLEDTSEQNPEVCSQDSRIDENVQITKEELLKVKQNYKVDDIYLGQLLDVKNLNNDLTKLQEKETELIQTRETVNEILSSVEKYVKQLQDTLHIKRQVTVENGELTDCLQTLEKERTDVMNQTNEYDNFRKETLEACNTLGKDLELLLQQQVLVNDINNNLKLKKVELQNNYEERKGFCSNEIYLMMKDSDLLTEEKCSLEQEMEKCKTELEFNVKAVGDYSDQIQQMKCRLHDNAVRIDTLQDEIQISERSVNEKQNKFRMDLSELQNVVSVKYNLKVEAEVEIERLTCLHSKITELVEECEALHLIQQSDMNQLKESFMSELQDKRNELEYRKNELECLHKEKMSEVTDLNGDIIEGGRSERYMEKRIHEFARINENRKKEISILCSTIKSLDSKLLTIAKTVAEGSQEVRSKSVSNQSTASSSGIGLSKSIKSVQKRQHDDYDSSSSGVSIRANDKSWKKRVIRRQQVKRDNQLSQSSRSCSSGVPLATSSTIGELQRNTREKKLMQNDPTGTSEKKSE